MGHILANIGFELAGLLAMAVIALTMIENWALVRAALGVEHRVNMIAPAVAVRRITPSRYRVPQVFELQRVAA